MDKERYDKIVDYFPIIAYAGFWVQGCLVGALATGDPRLVLLGLVTTPAVIAMVLAVRKIRNLHREKRFTTKTQSH